MTVKVWTVEEFLAGAEEHARSYVTDEELDEVNDGPSWLDSTRTLARRAITRGDGVAVYVNEDLGSRELGQWQIVSYGSEASQLESRHPVPPAHAAHVFIHGQDAVPVTLPDIGGRINWRYQLHAIVPSHEQLELAAAAAKRIRLLAEPADLYEHLTVQHHHIVEGLTDADLPHWRERHLDKLHSPTAYVPVPHTHERGIGEAFNDPRVPCCGRDAADCDCTTTLELGTPELLELQRVWSTGDDDLLQRRIVGLVGDIFEGIDGNLQKLVGITPDDSRKTISLEVLNGVTDHFLVAFNRPGRIEVVLRPVGVVAHVYDGAVGTPDQEPLFAYDGADHNENVEL